jgi:hypothetical protein
VGVERTVYTLTEKGRHASEYAATPVSVLPIKSDALLRLLICDLVGADVTRESLATLRTDVADLRERVADARAAATHLPHGTRYLIVTDFLERFLVTPVPASVRSLQWLGMTHSPFGWPSSWLRSRWASTSGSASRWSMCCASA